MNERDNFKGFCCYPEAWNFKDSQYDGYNMSYQTGYEKEGCYNAGWDRNDTLWEDRRNEYDSYQEREYGRCQKRCENYDKPECDKKHGNRCFFCNFFRCFR